MLVEEVVSNDQGILSMGHVIALRLSSFVY
jgi:hypothetical protein